MDSDASKRAYEMTLSDSLEVPLEVGKPAKLASCAAKQFDWVCFLFGDVWLGKQGQDGFWPEGGQRWKGVFFEAQAHG